MIHFEDRREMRPKENIRKSMIRTMDKGTLLKNTEDVALFTFMEMLSIRDVIRWKEDVRDINKKDKTVRIPQCILSPYSSNDSFDFDENSIELLKQHFHFR